ncbi:MAG TPA: hypothetical protein VKE22_09860 [Haliangiales bacterium]|nr:hypothetical protein [Haliangiales bacterium]
MKVGLIGTALAVVLLGACKSEDQPDARMVVMFPDSPPPPADARPATPDAPPPATFSGTISIQDVQILVSNGAGGVIVAPNSGHGGNITVSFTQDGTPVEASMSTAVFPPCNAVLRDITKPAQVVTQSNEGTVAFTISGGTVIPTCSLQAGAYRCIGAAGSAGMIAPTPPGGLGISSFTGTAVAAFGANDVGRALVFGSGTAIPIVGFDATAPTLILQGEVTVAATGSWSTVAGTGLPVAFTSNLAGTKGASPDFLKLGDTVTAAFTPGASSHFTAFTATGVVSNDVAWVLDTASQTALGSGILGATGAVRLGCKTDGGGAACGNGLGTIVAIDTTDTMPTGATDFPAPTKFAGSLTCATLDSGTQQYVEIAKSLIDVLNMGSPKRARISIFRSGFSPQAAGKVNVVAGRGYVKFEGP